MKFTKSINYAIEDSRTDGSDHIELLSAGKTDFFLAPDGSSCKTNAPLLLAETDNTRPFTFIAKVIPEFKNIYDAGAVFVYVDNEFWQKFAFEMDEEKNTRIVTVRTKGSSDDNNHSIIIQESVYLKISSDTRQIGFYYSRDKEIWNMARLYRNDFPDRIYLGISSQSPTGDGNQTLFENISLTDTPVNDFRMGV